MLVSVLGQIIEDHPLVGTLGLTGFKNYESLQKYIIEAEL